MNKIAISTSQAPAAIGPYSQAIKAGGLIFCSGQIPLDPATNTVISADIEEQTRQVLTNVKSILESEKLSMDNVVKTTLYLTDITTFAKVNEIYATFFREPFPARATIEVSHLPKDVLIEIEAIAAYQ